MNSGVVGQKIGRARSCNFLTNTANFRQNFGKKLQIFHRKDCGCSTFNFVSKIFLKSPNLAFLNKHFSTKKPLTIFRQSKIWVQNCPFNTITCPLATTLQPVNRIESNRICYQSNRPPLPDRRTD